MRERRGDSELGEKDGAAEAPPADLDAFISYTRRHQDDRQFVEWLRDALASRGQQVWVDRTNIEPGADWRSRIDRGIEAARAVIFVISPEAVTSEECGRELEVARRQNKKFIPLLLRWVDPSELPPEISTSNWIDCSDGGDRSAALPSILEALADDLAWRDLHARLGVQAREWREAGEDRSYLLTGRNLRVATEWYADRDGHAQPPTLEQERYLNASRHRSSRRQRRGLAMVATALVGSLALSIFAWVQRDRAIETAHVAQSQEMALSALDVIGTDVPLGIELSLQAFARSPTDRARDALIVAGQLPLAGVYTTDESPVAALAFNSAQELVSVDANGGVQSIAIPAGRVETLIDADESLAGVSPSGGHVVTTSTSTVSVRETRSGELVMKAVTEVNLSKTAIAFSPDGALMAIGSKQSEFLTPDDATATVVVPPTGHDVEVWDLVSGRSILRLRSPNYDVNSLAVSHDRRWLAVGGFGGDVSVFDLSDGTLVATFPRGAGPFISDPASSLAFTPDDQILAVGHGFGAVHQWNVQVCIQQRAVQCDELPANLPAGGQPNVLVSYSPTGDKLLTLDRDGVVSLWGGEPGTSIRTTRITEWDSGAGDSAIAAFSPDGKEIATGDSGGRVLLWGVESRARALIPASGPSWSTIPRTVFSENGSQFQIATFNGITFWDVASSTSRQGALESDISAFSNDGSLYAAQGADGADGGRTTVLVRTTSGGEVAEVPTDGVARSITFGPDDSILAIVDSNGRLTLWDTVEWNRGLSWEIGEAVLLGFTPPGAEVATSDGDTLTLWDVRSGDITSKVQTGAISSGVAFTSDGLSVAAQVSAGRLVIWDTATGRELTSIDPHGVVTSLVFDESGELITADDAGNVVLWNSRSGTRVAVLSRPSDESFPETTLRFSRDQSALVVGDLRRMLIVRAFPWRTDVDSLRGALCDELRGWKMGQDDWDRYAGRGNRAAC